MISISLDTSLDQKLINEGLAREFINRVQKTRKKLDFNVDDRIEIKYQCSTKLKTAIEEHKELICQETLGLSINISDKPLIEEFDIDDQKLTLELKKTVIVR